MSRYEFRRGASAKFWQIVLSGNAFTTTFGRLGSTGQTTVKTFATPAAARTAHDRLVAEKIKKGYVGAPKRTKARAIKRNAPKATTTTTAATRKPRATPPGTLVLALFAFIAGCRKHRNRTLEKRYRAFAAIETRPVYRRLFELLAVHASIGFGELVGLGVGPVRRSDDTDRTDVVGIGSDGGGNIFAIAAPGTSDSERITRFLPRDNWRADCAWSDLEEFLAEIDEGERARLEVDHPGDAMQRTTLRSASQC